MNLRIGTANGRKYLSIVQSYRDPITKKPRSRTVKSLGYLDELKEQYGDPESHFRAVVAGMNREWAEQKKPATVAIDREGRLEASGNNRKNIGYAALSKLYHGLGLHTFFNNRSRSWGTGYNVNSIMRLLVYSRILAPSSKKKAFEGKGMYFEKMDFSIADVYRCLSKVIALKRDITLYLHKQMCDAYGRAGGIVYYDVTNYYFEIDGQDDMRKKGVSKEHRPDPIIQMGLLTDAAGIPITYETFPGNTNDCDTYAPVFREVRKHFGLGRIVIVADKGMNTGNNIARCVLSGNGYVFSKSVRGASGELKRYVLDGNGYRAMGNGSRLKSRLCPTTINVTDSAGRMQKVPIDEKQVVFYSPDYDRRAKADRQAVVAKARELVGDPSRYNRATSYGAARYVKNITFDRKTGEPLTSKQSPVFDEAKLAEEEKYDGYYAIVTSECEVPDESILDMYRGLWQIEEAFKVCKNDLEARPVYLSRPERIEAHFLICFIALIVARLLVRTLGGQFPIGKVADSLIKASGSHLDENWYLFDYADDVTAALREHMDIDLGRKFMTYGDIRLLIGNTKK